jgi:L-threonylcarbamoyladenylate synthase
MLAYSVSPTDPDRTSIAAAADLLRGGGVVAYATDTLYGLAADPRLDHGVARLFDVKGRPAQTAIPLIASSLEQAETVGEFSEPDLRLAREFWPGPLTIVVPARPGLSAAILAGGRTVAIRVPAHAVACRLAEQLGSPVTSTSANRSGSPPPASAPALDPEIVRRIDAVIDSGPAPGGEPSTIVMMTSAGLQLIRPGAIAWDRVLRSAARG